MDRLLSEEEEEVGKKKDAIVAVNQKGETC